MTPTDEPSSHAEEPFDDDHSSAFERRLSDQLTTRASTLTAPREGLDRIHRRVAHRRRTRLATWAVATAAALFLVAGVTSVLLRSTTTDSSPFIDTTTDTTPAPTESGSLPLLAFGDTVAVMAVEPGLSYQVDDRGDDSSTRAQLIVSAETLRLPEPQEGRGVVRLGEQILPVVETAMESYTVPLVTWHPTSSTTAKLFVQRRSVPFGTDSTSVIQAALDRLHPVSDGEFVEAARRSPGDNRPLDALVLAGGTKGVSVDSLYPTDSLLYWIDEPSLGSPAELKIVRSQRYGGNPYLGKGEAAVVRNVTGVFVPADGPGLDGQRRDLLAWEADGFVVELRMPGSDSSAAMVAFAKSLRLASDDEWVELILGGG